ncbi:hypothetical protein AB0J86_30225 [Micromonospora sp. NPDC049559]|uniref:hypothetical protein n=1 Tax=Micromonospora sp. NPDC049559 TaxID=3155923 RepID=UPI00341CA69E
MNGELAQCLAIATHVTMGLAQSRGGLSRADGLLGLPQFADLVAFDSVVGVEAWVDRLADDGVDRLWFAVADLGAADWPGGLPAPASAGFVGGVPIGLLGTGSAGSRLWKSQWSAGARVADGAQILIANYVSQPRPVVPARVGMGTASHELDQALEKATEFAVRQQLPTWARVFAEARRQPARDATPRAGRPRDLFPVSWPDADGPRLADRALAAWVFGGMGSWNDLGFADGGVRQEYEQISRDLLETVLRACIAAVNIDLP